MGHSSPARAGKTPAVVTFTANPSIDRTIVLGQALERGEVQRARGVFEQAAGKGVNVAQVLFNAGIDVAVVTAAVDAPYRALSDRAQTPLAVVGVPLSGAQRVRVNTTITEPDGTTTKINEAGPELTSAQVALAAEALTDVARGAAWVALSGSLPPGALEDWYATLAIAVRRGGTKVAIDTSGVALDAVLAALPSAAFDLIKPNSEELAQLTGGDAAAFERAAADGDLTAIVEAAATLRDRGIANVLVTLGGSGAVLVNAEGAWYGTAPRIDVASTVGAGDSSVAGFLLAEVSGDPAPTCLAAAIAYGTAAASLPGTTLPTRADLPADPVVTTPIPVSRRA